MTPRPLPLVSLQDLGFVTANGAQAAPISKEAASRQMTVTRQFGRRRHLLCMQRNAQSWNCFE
jgi:hypothetical protein